MDITSAINTLLAICGGISIIGGAAAVIWKWVKPSVNLRKRVEKLEEKSQNDYEAINEIKDMQSLLVQAMIALIDNRLTGNNIDGLKKTKEDMIRYLSEQK